ncbi:MAG: transglutaminase domain-containing protein [Lentisphaeria bacterium]|nr:transglutaminase domain-containing protein [Lentisphaeria bacterium]
MTAVPTLDLPIAESRNYYTAGLGLALSGTYLLHPPVHLRLGVAYGYSPLVTTGGMSRASATLGVGVEGSLGGRFVLSGYGAAGYGVGLASYLGSVRSGGSLAWVLGTGVGFRASPSFTLGLAAGLTGISGLYTGVSLGLVGAYRFPGRERSSGPPLQEPPGLTPGQTTAGAARAPGEAPAAGEAPIGTADAQILIGEPRLGPVYPVLYRRYRETPFGSLPIRNVGESRAENIQVTVFVPACMEAPSDCGEPFALDPGEQREVALTAALDGRLLGFAESVALGAEVAVQYPTGGQGEGEGRDEREPFVLDVQDRNAILWDDVRKAAAFITAGDPLVHGLSRNVRRIALEAGFATLSENLLAAMGTYYALQQVGVRPSGPCSWSGAVTSGEPGSVAEVVGVQFPRETIENRGGDCMELAVLYCALLESVGIPSALIMAPGQVYPAVSLELSGSEDRTRVRRIDELILAGDTVWLPVELGSLEGGFLEAWARGAARWREFSGGGRAHMQETREAWELYPAVELPLEATAPVRIDAGRLAAMLRAEQVRLFDQDFWGR